VPHSQRRLKPHTSSRGPSAAARPRPIQPGASAVLNQPHRAAWPDPRLSRPARLGPSVWFDALAGLALCTAIAGVIAYFFGWLTALAGLGAIIIALAWCLNRSVDDTIEF